MREEPIILEMLGEKYALNPRVLPSGTCVYQSVPLELWIMTSQGRIRVHGKLTLTPWRSKGWEPV